MQSDFLSIDSGVLAYTILRDLLFPFAHYKLWHFAKWNDLEHDESQWATCSHVKYA